MEARLTAMDFLNLDRPARLFRTTLGIGLLILGWWESAPEPGLWAVSLRVAALYPLLTGMAGWCPLKVLWEQASPSLRRFRWSDLFPNDFGKDDDRREE